MKKRIIISIVLLIICFGTCAVSFGLIANELGKLRGSLYDAIYTAEGVGMSGTETDAVLADWGEAKKSFDVLLDEKDIGELEKLIPTLSDSLMKGDVNGYLETCLECIHYIDVIFDNISLNAGNIF